MFSIFSVNYTITDRLYKCNKIQKEQLVGLNSVIFRHFESTKLHDFKIFIKTFKICDEHLNFCHLHEGDLMNQLSIKLCKIPQTTVNNQ